MKQTIRTIVVLAFLLITHVVSYAQVVVVANRNVTYEDPRFGSTAKVPKGEAISVSNSRGSTYEWFLYPAASVDLPKSAFHIPGSVNGEKCIVVNGTNVRFREGPSLKTGIYCYDCMSAASYYRYEFVKDAKIKRDYTNADGLIVRWEPITMPKGTRLPYKGKVGDFYKTAFDGYTLYISAKYSYLK